MSNIKGMIVEIETKICEYIVHVYYPEGIETRTSWYRYPGNVREIPELESEVSRFVALTHGPLKRVEVYYGRYYGMNAGRCEKQPPRPIISSRTTVAMLLRELSNACRVCVSFFASYCWWLRISESRSSKSIHDHPLYHVIHEISIGFDAFWLLKCSVWGPFLFWMPRVRREFLL